eukprot:TRINITY_DN49455_c0_g1_i1.p1 TRINITY_DN49455_c0_g1~~TRINITY_DN49455_c0_g1_i1.p1  ORF type:complete len:434 (+),score=56.63 TRINITY_DN49455_c0_g1_i1:48-1349(+)
MPDVLNACDSEATPKEEALARIAIGHHLQEKGDYLGACDAYREAGGLDPRAIEAWISLAFLQEEMNEFTLAASSYAKALEIAPRDANLWNFKGAALRASGQHAEAVSCHSKAINLLQDFGADADTLADAHVLLGDACRRADPGTPLRYSPLEFERALAEYECALALSPTHAGALAACSLIRAPVFWHRVAKVIAVKTPVILQPYLSETLATAHYCSQEANPLRSVHALHWLDRERCSQLIADVETYVAENGGWNKQPRRHDNFSTMDIEVSSIPEFREWMPLALHSVVLPSMAHLFQISVKRLRVMEAFYVRYSSQQGEQHELPLHRDGAVLSFNILLSDPETFEGGGTYFESLGLSVHLERAGDILMHSGQMLHGGNPITFGVRRILVGFVQVCEPDVRELIATQNNEEEKREDPESDNVILDKYWKTICTT